MAGLVMFMASAAYADSQDIITPGTTAPVLLQNLQDKQKVTLQGTVEKAQDNREFELRVNNEIIPVKIVSGQSLVFKDGDKVAVTGTVDEKWFGLLGKVIDATNVQVEKSLSQALSDTVKDTTGISFDAAKAVLINNLPAQGSAQIAGTVDNVADAKDFTLKDNTGSINVHIQSDENVALTKGVLVTVTGYVNNGQLTRNFLATHINITGNTSPHA